MISRHLITALTSALMLSSAHVAAAEEPAPAEPILELPATPPPPPKRSRRAAQKRGAVAKRDVAPIEPAGEGGRAAHEGGLVASPAPPTRPAAEPAIVAPHPAEATAHAEHAPAKEKDAVADAHGHDDDHSKIVGRWGFAYFGVTDVPIAIATPPGATTEGGFAKGNIHATMIGLSRWMSRDFGFDLGVGFGVSDSGETKSERGEGHSVSHEPRYAFVGRAGFAIALGHGKHHTFELVPDLTLAYAHGGVDLQGGAVHAVTTGLKFDVGARVGAEIQFGFIGLHELALQIGLGAYISHDIVKLQEPERSTSESQTAFSTSVTGSPLANVASNIGIIYYL